jgi:hypothetical protein
MRGPKEFFPMKAPRLPADFFRIAATAPCDLKTARAFFQPGKREKMKPTTAERVRVAVVALGFDDPAANHQAA